MRLYPQILQKIIEESGLNHNQISQASGISNPYLAKLARGQINRPGKDKIASIMLSLNFMISDINRVLSEYNYPSLCLGDIPPILNNNKARKIIGGSLPHYDHIYNDLLLVVLERLGGKKILVKDRPSGVFMPHELYLMKEYPFEANNKAATFRYHLTEATLKERSAVFLENCATGSCSETYICKLCFENYIETNLGKAAKNHPPRKKELVLHYLANALSLSLKHPQQHQILIMERCPYFHFLMQDAEGSKPKVSYPGKKIHSYNNESDKRILEGFTTDLPQVISHFRHEIEMCKTAVPASLLNNYPQSLKEYFFSIMKRHNLTDQFQVILNRVMQSPSGSFY